MECGLDEAPLPGVERSFARQQSFTEEDFRPLQHAALDETVLVRDEHVPDGGGVGELVDVLRPDAEEGDIAELARGPQEEAGRIPAEGRILAEDRRIPGTRRTTQCGGGHMSNSHRLPCRRRYGSLHTTRRDPVTLFYGEIALEYAAHQAVEAVALGGSRSTGYGEDDADIDLYVYSRTALPEEFRAEVARRRGVRIEAGNRFWEPGDEWVEAGGAHVDVMFRTTDWIEDQLARVLERYEASVGYSTCFWANVLNSQVLFDREGWFGGLQERARVPYPEPLRRAIVAKNHPILRATLSSYRRQIARAVERRDPVSVSHRVAALLASAFDLLFAVNRVPHPGEKRILLWVEERCPNRPPYFIDHVRAMLEASGAALLERIDALVDGIDEMVAREGLAVAANSVRIDHVALWTRDLEQSREFYEKWFGAVAGSRYESARRPFASYFLTFPSGSRLELMQAPGIADSGECDRLGWAHIAIAAGSREAVDELSARMTEAGHRLLSAPRMTGDGYYESVVADPDGNAVEITE
jgi:catechol 2,3-dioxygenase-like lactoylglutathione lyase family enzyme